MTEEKTTAELEAEKQAAESAANSGEGVETNGGAGDDDAGLDVEKKDYSKMSDEEIVADLKEKHSSATPDELLTLLAKNTKIISHKNRAIDSLKKTPKKLDETKPEEKKVEVDDLDKPLTRRDLIEQNNLNAVEALINTETTDPEERKAIKEAYQKDIVKSGDVATDFKKALAIASVDDISEYRKNRANSTMIEDDIVNFSGAGNTGGGNKGNVANDAVKRSVAQNLKNAGLNQKEIDAEIAKL